MFICAKDSPAKNRGCSIRTDVDTWHDLPDSLPAALYYDFSFLPDASGFYYSTMIDDGPRVRLHKMGTPVTSDTEVFGKGYQKEAIVVADLSWFIPGIP